MSLPTGLAGAYQALGNHGDSHLLAERLSTLAWLRQLTDASMPLAGGHDPRTILQPFMPWQEVAALEPDHLDVLCGRLNDVMGEALLSVDWTNVPPETLARATREISRWRVHEWQEGDVLAVLHQEITSQGTKSARGAFYTPYHVALMMAMMVAPEPGQSVCDPCCGSGTMLLAALEACRRAHGLDATLRVFGVDIDPAAVRLAKMNLALAGIAPGGRVEREDALAPEVVAELKAQAFGQMPLFE